MRNEFADQADAFRGSRGWMRRFFKRFSLCRRKKTNVKSTTWEETRPKLEKYCRATRRRMRDDKWKADRARAIAAARAAAPGVTTAAAPSDATPPAHADALPSNPASPEGEAGRKRARAVWDAGNDGSDDDGEAEAAAIRAAQAKARATTSAAAISAAAAAAITAAPAADDADDPPIEPPPSLPIAPPTTTAPSAASVDEKRVRDEMAAAEADLPWWQRGRSKYGKYLPHQRVNVDQVPLSFIFEMDHTYEEKGAKKVAINQLGPSMSKRQCTGQMAVRAEPPPPPPRDAAPEVRKQYFDNLMKQPPPCLLFRGTGKQISQRELDAYPKELTVLWQPKAWADRPVVIEWARQCYKQMIEADIAAGIADKSSRYLLLQDNLDSQCQPEYLRVLREECQTDDHKVVPNLTDQTQPVDDGLGRQVQIYMGREEDKWLEDDNNMSKWENNELTASDRRILLAHW